MSVEAYNGLVRLRTAAALSVIASLFGLLSQAVGFSLSGSAALGELFPAVAMLMAVGVLMIILGIATWVLKVMGWGSLCKARLRKFYCLTRLIVLGAPIVGVILIIAGVLTTFIEVFSSIASGPELSLLDEKIIASISGYIIAGAVIMAAGNVFEGVASLDLGFSTKENVLIVGSLLYLVSVTVSVLSQVSRELGIISPIVSLAGNVFLVAGYHTAKKHFIVSSPQTAAATVAQGSGG
ncbi:MAG: hypothetical protein QW291_02935 [Thermofilaceae archaeon]